MTGPIPSRVGWAVPRHGPPAEEDQDWGKARVSDRLTLGLMRGRGHDWTWGDRFAAGYCAAHTLGFPGGDGPISPTDSPYRPHAQTNVRLKR